MTAGVPITRKPSSVNSGTAVSYSGTAADKIKPAEGVRGIYKIMTPRIE